jgi:hypothetical protein
MRKMAPFLPGFVTEIAIKRLDDGFIFTKFEELDADSDMHSVLMEVSTRLLGKFRAGNPSPQS